MGHLPCGCKTEVQNRQRTNHATSDCRAPGGARHKPQGNASINRGEEYRFTFASFSEGAKRATVSHELLIDSGCTGYMVKDRDLFLDLELSEQGTVGCANASTSTIEGSGTAAFWIKDADGRMRRMELKDALYVPSYSHNLVSVKRLLDRGVKVQIEETPR